jgi:ABC-2 type transport system permease protein
MRALRVIYTIWLRECKATLREPSRLIGMIGQPLLYLLIVGQGIASGLTLNQAPSGSIDYLKFIYPGILAMSVLFTSMFSAVSIIWDREFGFLKEVLVAPVPRWAIAVGKVLGGATVAMAQSIILILLAPIAGIWPSLSMVLELLLLCFLISCTVTSLGVAIAARMRSMQGFQMLMNFLIMPLYFLSGAMFPVATAPVWMQVLMTINPLRYGVDALRLVVFSTIAAEGTSGTLAEVARAKGLIGPALLNDVLVLAVLAVLLLTVAAFRFRSTE